MTCRNERATRRLVGVLGRVTIAFAVLSVLSCDTQGGDYVGAQADPRRGVECWQCLEDPPPEPVDCALAEDGVEFLPVTLWDFDTAASNLYFYQDNSASFARIGDTDSRDNWQPPVEQVRRCKEAPADETTGVFHVEAGPFTNWGGGIGRNLKCLNGSPYRGVMKLGSNPGSVLDLACDFTDRVKACQDYPLLEDASAEDRLAATACPERDQKVIDADGDIGDAIAAEDEFLLGTTLDLSDWDGISFWARRSNDSQPGFRLNLGDKFTSDDVSFLQYHINPDDRRLCERNIACGCPGNTRCYEKLGDGDGDGVEDSEPSMRCWDAPPRSIGEAYVPCGQSECTDEEGSLDWYDPYQTEDAASENTTCELYAFRGGIEEPYCVNESEGKVPFENVRLCGDHWQRSIHLSTEWQFYKVPFNTLIQQGWAQESFLLDLTSAAVLRFTWGTGWVDFWLDDVRVYRNKHGRSEH